MMEDFVKEAELDLPVLPVSIVPVPTVTVVDLTESPKPVKEAELDDADEEEEDDEEDVEEEDGDDACTDEEEGEDEEEEDEETEADKAFVVTGKRARDPAADLNATPVDDDDALDPERIWTKEEDEEYIPPSRRCPRKAHKITNLAIEVSSHMLAADTDMGEKAEVAAQELGVSAPEVTLEAAGLPQPILDKLARLAELQREKQEEERAKFKTGANGKGLITEPFVNAPDDPEHTDEAEDADVTIAQLQADTKAMTETIVNSSSAIVQAIAEFHQAIQTVPLTTAISEPVEPVANDTGTTSSSVGNSSASAEPEPTSTSSADPSSA